ncbi:MAG TPA: hypothetical protein VEH31_41695, partial [Streptosporangiaceae bacterium]|nr:hypothetical protein [Streptosporangiaceae bacterium]
IGCFNLIYGIAAVANAHVFVAGAHYVWGDLRFWGWATLIIGAVQLLAAAGVAAGSQLARWFGVAVLGINAIAMMFFLPAYPAVGAGDPRRRPGRGVGAVRLRQPRQHRSRLARRCLTGRYRRRGAFPRWLAPPSAGMGGFELATGRPAATPGRHRDAPMDAVHPGAARPAGSLSALTGLAGA